MDNVLVVIEFCCPGRGSIDDGVHLVLSELARRGLSVGLLTSDLCRYSGRRGAVAAEYMTWVAGSLRVHADAVLPREPSVVAGAVAWSDVVVVHEPYQPLSLYAMYHALKQGKRVVVWCDRYYSLSGLVSPLTWIARRLADKLWAAGLFAGLGYLTRDAYEWCRDTLRLPPNTPGYSLPIPYDPRVIEKAEEKSLWMLGYLDDMLGGHVPDVLVGYIGRLSKWKGIHVLEAAITRLAESGIDVKAVLGAPPWGNYYSPKTDNIVVVSMDRVEKLALLHAARKTMNAVYVQPSLKEPFGIALLEAMALGLPVVASNIAGPAEILGAGQYGLLVPPEDPARLAEAILQATLNHDKHAALAQQRAQHYTPKHVAGKWEEMVARTISIA